MSTDLKTLAERVRVERQRRLDQPNHPDGTWHYWIARGDDGPPTDGRGNPREHWCDFCAGWYGVPHAGFHERRSTRKADDYCPNLGRGCADIVCWVAEGRTEARRVG